MSLPLLYIGPAGSNVDACIERFGCGLRCRQGEADKAATFLRQLATDSTDREAYARRARSAFDQAYCDLRTLPQFDQVIECFMDGGTRRPPGHESALYVARASWIDRQASFRG